MRLIVYPNSLRIGGSLNAVEIAAAIRDRGHEVTVLGQPGPLAATVRGLGLGYVPLDPCAQRRPSWRAAGQLTRLARQRRIDVVHGYEWPPILEACAGPRLRLRVPAVGTIYSALVAPFLPGKMPLIVGTHETGHEAAAAGHSQVTIIEPPVDIRANRPGYDPGPFRQELGFDAGPLLVAVCRLAHQGKLEGLLAACDAVGRLAASGVRVRLAVVGDGPARAAVEEAAAAANSLARDRVVALTGELYDPRPAYAAADVVLGMGGSALRGMAFGKPLVVQGERGFWRLLTPESAPLFLRQGWYGLGPAADGRPAGALRLEAILRNLLADTAAWGRLGKYGRELVVGRFSLEHSAAVAEEVYARAMDASCRPSASRAAADAAMAWTGGLSHQTRRRWRRRLGKPVPLDDFNAIAGSTRQ